MASSRDILQFTPSPQPSAAHQIACHMENGRDFPLNVRLLVETCHTSPLSCAGSSIDWDISESPVNEHLSRTPTPGGGFEVSRAKTPLSRAVVKILSPFMTNSLRYLPWCADALFKRGENLSESLMYFKFLLIQLLRAPESCLGQAQIWKFFQKLDSRKPNPWK